MERIYVLIAILALLFALVGCTDTAPIKKGQSVYVKPEASVAEPAFTDEEMMLIESYEAMFDFIYSQSAGIGSSLEIVALNVDEQNEKVVAELNRYVAEKLNVEVISGDFETLKSQGVLTAAGGTTDLYEFTNGVIVTISDTKIKKDKITFTASMWRAPLAAVGCNDALLEKIDGVWTQVGDCEMWIS